MYEGIAAAGEAILVLRLPDERILLATDSARGLLAPQAGEPVGRPLSEFLGAPLGEPAELLLRGHLNGFQLHRVRAVGAAADLEVRVRAAADRAGSEPVLALLSPAGTEAAEPEAGRPPAAVGWVDGQLVVQQVSDEAAALLARSAEELTGQSLLSLIAPEDSERAAVRARSAGRRPGAGQPGRPADRSRPTSLPAGAGTARAGPELRLRAVRRDRRGSDAAAARVRP